MATNVISEEQLDLSKPIIRKKAITAKNDATLRTEIDCGEFGILVTDEPVPHGGTGEGPSPAPNSAWRTVRLRIGDIFPHGEGNGIPV